jgi:hypothetical protein
VAKNLAKNFFALHEERLLGIMRYYEWHLVIRPNVQ